MSFTRSSNLHGHTPERVRRIVITKPIAKDPVFALLTHDPWTASQPYGDGSYQYQLLTLLFPTSPLTKSLA